MPVTSFYLDISLYKYGHTSVAPQQAQICSARTCSVQSFGEHSGNL
jgi:hypothetical protein